MKAIAVLIASAVVALAAEAPNPDQVIAQVAARDRDRQAALSAYSYTSTYVLRNKDRYAEMVVRWTRHPDGTKDFAVISEQGDSGVRKHVFHRLLEAEVEASQPEQQAKTRISAENYSFQYAGADQVDGHEAWIFELEPKAENKYLTRGRIWVDACDFSILRIEGAPAHKVSFWTKDVNFVQSFEKNGDWWLPASNHSLTDARLFGLADLTIQYSDYQFAKPFPASAEIASR